MRAAIERRLVRRRRPVRDVGRAALLPAEQLLRRGGPASRRAVRSRACSRHARRRSRCSSVGNLTVGGTGKTPVAAWAARAAARARRTPGDRAARVRRRRAARAPRRSTPTCPSSSTPIACAAARERATRGRGRASCSTTRSSTGAPARVADVVLCQRRALARTRARCCRPARGASRSSALRRASTRRSSRARPRRSTEADAVAERVESRGAACRRRGRAPRAERRSSTCATATSRALDALAGRARRSPIAGDRRPGRVLRAARAHGARDVRRRSRSATTTRSPRADVARLVRARGGVRTRWSAR